jgi:hypothetical protein
MLVLDLPLLLYFIICMQTTLEENPEKGREAATPSLIKEIQEVQGGQEAPHDGGIIIPKDA